MTDAGFRPLVEAAGPDHAPIEGDIRKRLSDEHGLTGVTGNPIRLVALMKRLGRELAPVWARDGLAGCRGADALVAGGGSAFLAEALAERLDLPMVQGWLQPLAPTVEFTTPVFPPLPLTGAPARWTHLLMRRLIWAGMRQSMQLVRTALGLPPWPKAGPWVALERRPAFCAVSPALVARPADWPPGIDMTGFLFLDQPAWQPDPALDAFLTAGPTEGEPPVYLGFGSMMPRDPAALARTVAAAVRQVGRRTVVATGWGGIDPAVLAEARAAGVPLHVIDGAPHDRIFPRVAAAVHHGGAGTTAAALRAGIPSVVVPFLGDQGFWAERLCRAGVAPPALRLRRLTAERLAAAIAAVLGDPGMRERAAALGRIVRAEDGLAAAVRAVKGGIAAGRPAGTGMAVGGNAVVG